MSKLLFKLVNPIVAGLLRSPLHGVMSGNTLLLHFEGRKSGQPYTTPVSYREVGDEIHCFTDHANLWWRNLQGVDSIGLTVRGQRRSGKPSLVVADGSETLRSALRDFLLAVPRDAGHAEVGLDADGTPNEEDLAGASRRLVWISIALER